MYVESTSEQELITEQFNQTNTICVMMKHLAPSLNYQIICDPHLNNIKLNDFGITMLHHTINFLFITTAST